MLSLKLCRCSPDIFLSTRPRTVFCFVFVLVLSHFQPNLNVAILSVVTKDLPISPQFTPYEVLSPSKFDSITTRQLLLSNFTYSLHVLTLSATEERTQILVTRIELTTSALASVQVNY